MEVSVGPPTVPTRRETLFRLAQVAVTPTTTLAGG
jgi:hypothetical protein